MIFNVSNMAAATAAVAATTIGKQKQQYNWLE